jgi:acyl-CoA dehydrogenase
MDPFALSPLHEQIRTEAGEVGAALADRSREVRLHCIEKGEIHPELWSAFCERGWPGLVIPSSHGGADGGLLGLTLVVEELGASNLILWMSVLTAAIAHSLAEAGPAAAQERWLGPMALGRTLMALAATEPECGHNLFRVQTTVRPENGHFVVNGFKAVTSGIELVDRVLVFGRAPSESEDASPRFTTVLVDPDARGLTATEVPMGRREGVRQYQLQFDDVEVPRDALVGGEGQGLSVLWPFTHVERVLTAALGLGLARHCVTRAVERAKERTIFGETAIGANQAVQHPLASLHARLESARLFVYRTAARFDAGAEAAVVAGDSNIAKLVCSDLLYDAADQAVQTFGAAAMDEREGLLDILLDARLFRSAPISQELTLNFIAQHVLGMPRHR